MIACPYNLHICPFRYNCDQADPLFHIADHTHIQLPLKNAFLSRDYDRTNRINYMLYSQVRSLNSTLNGKCLFNQVSTIQYAKCD